jgi:hypothetical protein
VLAQAAASFSHFRAFSRQCAEACCESGTSYRPLLIVAQLSETHDRLSLTQSARTAQLQLVRATERRHVHSVC